MEIKNTQPYDNIIEDEQSDIILKLGAFLSIIHNKKINPAKMMSCVIKYQNVRKLFMRSLEIDSYQHLIKVLLQNYPTLYKSKIVNEAISKDGKESTESL